MGIYLRNVFAVTGLMVILYVLVMGYLTFFYIYEVLLLRRVCRICYVLCVLYVSVGSVYVVYDIFFFS